MTFTLFKPHTLEEHAQSLADFLPNGRAFMAKNLNDSNYRKKLRALAGEFQRFEENLGLSFSELDPEETTFFIEEWEKTVGIPDECFLGTGTLEERRIHIVCKLAKMAVTTAQEYEDLALKLGFVITIKSFADVNAFPYTFPYTFATTEKESRFTMIIEVSGSPPTERFPYTFPYVFGSESGTILECVMNKVKPAFVIILFEFVP